MVSAWREDTKGPSGGLAVREGRGYFAAIKLRLKNSRVSMASWRRASGVRKVCTSLTLTKERHACGLQVFGELLRLIHRDTLILGAMHDEEWRIRLCNVGDR